jgi:hypothetical protein
MYVEALTLASRGLGYRKNRQGVAREVWARSVQVDDLMLG